MHDLDDDTRKEVLGEVILDELKAIREYLEDVPIIKQKVSKLENAVEELRVDMKVVKAVLSDQSNQLQDHEMRLTRLEVTR